MEYNNAQSLHISPKELDAQSPVKISRWLDIDSEECKELDQDRQFTNKILRFGFEDKWLKVDAQGRVFGLDPQNNLYYPLHFEGRKKELIGYRITKKAAN